MPASAVVVPVVGLAVQVATIMGRVIHMMLFTMSVSSAARSASIMSFAMLQEILNQASVAMRILVRIGSSTCAVS